MKSNPIRLAITLGDVAGVGPEIVARVCHQFSVQTRADTRLLIIGDPNCVRRGATAAGVEFAVPVIKTPDQFAAHKVCCWNPSWPVADVAIGAVSDRAGQAAFDYVNAAIDLALVNPPAIPAVDAIVTAPINKYALHAAGIEFPGHTEILAHRCQVDEFSMMLYLGEALTGIRSLIGTVKQPASGLGIAHVTLHTSVKSVPQLLTTENVLDKIRLMNDFLNGIAPVAVCALNPHAGEDGLFGDEESTIIRPAIEQALQDGIDVAGPFPTDTLIRRAVRGEFGGVVAMYHDQGHIPFKLIGFDQAVNITLGLPIIRTSPSHGTAFDIAGKGIADPTGMLEAMDMAIQLARKKQRA